MSQTALEKFLKDRLKTHAPAASMEKIIPAEGMEPHVKVMINAGHAAESELEAFAASVKRKFTGIETALLPMQDEATSRVLVIPGKSKDLEVVAEAKGRNRVKAALERVQVAPGSRAEAFLRREKTGQRGGGRGESF